MTFNLGFDPSAAPVENRAKPFRADWVPAEAPSPMTEEERNRAESIARARERERLAFITTLFAADIAQPEAVFNNVTDMLDWLNC